MDLDRLRARGARAFPNAAADFVMNCVRAIVASEKDMPPDREGLLAATALRKLQGTEEGEPTPAELAALELMIRMTRPAPLVHGGIPDDFSKSEHAKIFPAWAQFRKAVGRFAQTIGRIDRAGSSLAASPTVGSGFLVGPGLLLTNRHVLNDISRATGVLEPGQAVVRFQIEDDCFAEDQPRKIIGVAAVNDSVDAVLLRIDVSPHAASAFPSIAGAREDDADIVVAGYPSETSDRNPLFVRSTFGTSLGVLRAAPGQITATAPNGFTHDCSTLGGNSGSPVFRMSTAEVIGLHSGGGFLWNNHAVDGTTLSPFVQSKLDGK